MRSRLPEEKSSVSHLKAGEVTFLGADVQRGATPKVPSVDVGSVGQKVLDDQVVVGGHSDLEGRLYPHGPGYTRLIKVTIGR